MDALAHLGPAVPDLDGAVLPEVHDRPGDLLEAVAETRVLEAQADADGLSGGDRLVVGGLDVVEAGAGAEAAVVHDLAGAPDVAGADHVAAAHLPAADAHGGGEAVHHALHGELGLVGAEAPEGAAHRVVGAHGSGLDVDGRHHIWAAGVAGGPLEDLHADRGVGAGVAEHPGPEGGEAALGVAPGAIGHADGVPLGVHEEGLLARQRAAHGPVQQEGGQRRLGLVRHVLLAAEGAAVAHQLDGDPLLVDAEHRRHLVAVVPDPLTAGVHVQPAVTGRDGQRGLGLEEGVLDALGLEDLLDDVGRRRQGRLDVTPGVGGDRQHVAVQFPDGVLVRRHGHDRVAERLEPHVLDVDEGGGPPGGLPVAGDDDGKDVAQVRGAPALGDEHRPVDVDEADPQLAGHVGGGEHGLDAVDGGRRRGVDADHVGPGVVGQSERPVEHPLRRQVVDERPVAEAQLACLVLGSAGAQPTQRQGHGHLAGRQRLDGVEDLHVARAPAQVGAEVPGGVVTGEGVALLVEERLGAHDDAGRAEPALQGTVGGERRRIPVALGAVEPLEGRDRRPLGLVHRRLAGDAGLAVQQHRAAAALARRRTAVLGRQYAELVAECRQQVRMVGGGLDQLAVEFEGRHRSPSPSTPSRPSAAATSAGTSTPAWPVIAPYTSGRR